MHYYLSSYLLGNQTDYLQKQSSKYRKIAYIRNAWDITSFDADRYNKSNIEILDSLENPGFEVENLDLKDYFENSDKLKDKLEEFDGVFVRGGNVFALRQAMKLSGFDDIITEYAKNKLDFLYMGFSAGICVLTPSLRGIELVDSVDQSIHLKAIDLVWEGLGLIDFAIAPHYKSNHPESADIDNLVDYYINNKILFKALKDGEVIIID